MCFGKTISVDRNDIWTSDLLDGQDGVFGEMPEKPSHKKAWLAGGGALAALAAAGVIAAYFLSPAVHTFINHTASQIQSGMVNVHLTGQQALLYIGLPIAGACLATGLIVHVYRKHQRLKRDSLYILDGVSFKDTLKEMKPTKRGLAITGIVLSALVLAGLTGFAVMHYVPSANQWMNQQALPFAQGVLNHKLQLWQALAYVGGGTAGAALIAGLGIRTIQYVIDRREDQRRSDNYYVQTDTDT